MTGKKRQKRQRQRDAPLSYRPPTTLRAEFLARVERSGLSVNAFITQAVFGGDPPHQSRRPPLEKALLARLLGEAAQIRDVLHEIALTGGDTPANTLQVEAALADLTEIRAALFQALGRKP